MGVMPQIASGEARGHCAMRPRQSIFFIDVNRASAHAAGDVRAPGFANDLAMMMSSPGPTCSSMCR